MKHIILLFLTLSLSSCFQQKETDSVRKVINISTTALASTNLIDLGSINLSEAVEYSFKVQNTGDNPLVIIGVDTSCGCMTAEYEKASIKKGNQMNITLTYIPKQRGKFQETFNKSRG